MFALTLVKTDTPPLSAAHIALVQGALEQCNIRPGNRPPVWMEGHRAVRGWVLDRPTPEQMGLLRGVLDPHKIDVICEADGMKKLQLACFDLESTCIEQESLDVLAERLGQGKEVEAITARAMNGEINMHDAFIARVAMLKGVGDDDIDAVAAQLTGFEHMHDTIRWLQSNGVRCVLVSSGADVFVKPMALKFGFDGFFCSHLDIEGGLLNGQSSRILSKQGKADTALQLMNEMGIEPAQALAMGDGANDELLLSTVGRPFGWRPKPVLAKVASNQFNHADWRSLRYALA